MRESLRCFIAVELPPEVKGELARIPEGMRGVGASGIHLTLKFLGEGG